MTIMQFFKEIERNRFTLSSKSNVFLFLKLSFPRDRYLKATIKLVFRCRSRKSFTFYLLLGDVNGSRFRFRQRKRPFKILQKILSGSRYVDFFGTSYMREEAEAATGSWRNAREENIKGPKEATFQASKKSE